MLKNIKCPLCGGDLIETGKAFTCINWKKEDGGCKFTVWKESFGAVFDADDAEKLIRGESVEKMNVSKKGNKYPAVWELDDAKNMHYTYVGITECTG